MSKNDFVEQLNSLTHLMPERDGLIISTHSDMITYSHQESIKVYSVTHQIQ